MTIQQKTVDAIRILSAEAISRAGTGHPGICLDAAPILYTLFGEVMKYSNRCPRWENRDRFVLSAGHGSSMLYSALHLFGFDVTKEDLMNFRQFGSKTPGHPEYGVTDGIDVSTGPLGQGIANAVGFAVAETRLAAEFNREGFPVVDHFTYALCGDGCLEEGISYEACSFAGRQKLGKLILFYDKNDVSIEGDVAETFCEDISARFTAQGWQVLHVKDINDLSQLKAAVHDAKEEKSKPSVIICNSVIGYGSPLAGSATIHGTPLTAEQLAQTKDFYNWNEPPFGVPQAVRYHCDQIARDNGSKEREWRRLFARYEEQFPVLAEEYKAYFGGGLPDLSSLSENLGNGWDSTRSSGGKVLNKIAEIVPNIFSGSADLSPSTKTNLKGDGWYLPDNRTGRNIHFGIREHAMAAICNGIRLHGGLRIVCSTFLAFSDYMKGAMRMSAIMKLPVIYVLTHDSIGVGEDGPTHQPVEQLAALRAMPGLDVFRPCDESETAAAFLSAFESDRPSAIVLSRQNLQQYALGWHSARRGGYVIDDCEGSPDVLLIATGSEVMLCSQAKRILAGKNIRARVVSMPCRELFERQSAEYRDRVIPSSVKVRICVEAASGYGWKEYAGDDGAVVSMQTFGMSAPMEKLYSHFGFTAQNIAEKALGLLSRRKEKSLGKY